MIGLDTSHCEAFIKLLNNPEVPYHVPGGRVELAYKGGSDDLEVSYSRIEGITKKLTEEYGIKLVDTLEEVAEASDAILLTSVDGRVHLEQFRAIAPYGKPVYIDKPFSATTEEAREMLQLARDYNVPLMSASSLRYAEDFVQALQQDEGEVLGMDCSGPMVESAPMPFYHWYGIHCVEMLYRGLGKGCKQVTVTCNGDYDMIVGVWEDGRIGTARGNRKGNNSFGVVIHREKTIQLVDARKHPKPLYAGLLEDTMRMFQSRVSPIEPEETVEIMRFLEAANESRVTGQTVLL
ncbi:gfo/Idh/MocA family oxidoreductase [Paenibacillus cremeus]|uniref:Gfo/Idh/MocA family oxidoreductase n=2 Tax=Paenibacillus cremeus TaxID=2163881 RepID=A0A559K7P7_9BACL|nr:gfo/Idh/MocA family oxidoreductase [Paenibacillus cremeus]